MTKPVASRKADVQSKLEYAEHRRQELMNVLFSAKKESSDPAFLVHSCADIISGVRECFDYLGQDIVDGYVIPNTTNAKLKNDFATGKVKAYFPYFESQLTKPGAIFFEVGSHSRALHQDLLAFTRDVSSGAIIPNTLFSYTIFNDVREMVNEKKHDKLLAVVSDTDAEFLIESPGFSMILPIKEQVGWSSFAVSPGVKVERVAEYRFAFNQVEVAKFCLGATKATEIVIKALYANHFS